MGQSALSNCACYTVIYFYVLVGISLTKGDPNSTIADRSRSLSPFEMHSCVAHPDGVYPDPFDCHRYYHCIGQKTFYFHCFEGFVFDPCRQRCVSQTDCIGISDCAYQPISVPTRAGHMRIGNVDQGHPPLHQIDLLVNRNNSKLILGDTDEISEPIEHSASNDTGGQQEVTESGTEENRISRSTQSVGGTKTSAIRPVASVAYETLSTAPGGYEEGEEENQTPIDSGSTTNLEQGGPNDEAFGGSDTTDVPSPEPTEVVAPQENVTAEITSSTVANEGGAGVEIGNQSSPVLPNQSTPDQGEENVSTTGLQPEFGTGNVTQAPPHAATYLVRVIFNRRISNSEQNTTIGNVPAATAEPTVGDGSIETSFGPSEQSTVENDNENDEVPGATTVAISDVRVNATTESSTDAPGSGSSSDQSQSNQTDVEISTPGNYSEYSEHASWTSHQSTYFTAIVSTANLLTNALYNDTVNINSSNPQVSTTEAVSIQNEPSNGPPDENANDSQKRESTNGSVGYSEDGIGSLPSNYTQYNNGLNESGVQNSGTSEQRGTVEGFKQVSLSMHQDQRMLLRAINNEFEPQLDYKFVAGKTVVANVEDLISELNVTSLCRSPESSSSTPCHCPVSPTAGSKMSRMFSASTSSSPLFQDEDNARSYCSLLSCLNGAMYVELSDGACGCLCPRGWKGNQCQHLVDHTQCHCANGGRCVSVVNDTFACLCPIGYFGGQCQHQYLSLR